MAPPDITAAPARRIEVDVVGGKPAGGARTERVRIGERVALFVTADTEDEVHVHGYDLKADVGPGAPATIEFTASIPGAFEVELEGSHQLVLELEVS